MRAKFNQSFKIQAVENDFSQMLTKVTVEAALNAELETHLGYDKHQATPHKNSRNGFSTKRIKTEEGQFVVDIPRYRQAEFEPQNEGAKFWLNVLTELTNRSVKDILIVCVDGLKGFPEAINAAFPDTHIQLCIVHMVRNSLKYVTWKDYKAVTADLKLIYKATTEEDSALALEQFAAKWDDKYPQISKSWRNHCENLNTFFDYPTDIRKTIYTTNAIESLNSVIQSFEGELRSQHRVYDGVAKWHVRRTAGAPKAIAVVLSFCRLLGLGCPKQAFAKIATPW